MKKTLAILLISTGLGIAGDAEDLAAMAHLMAVLNGQTQPQQEYPDPQLQAIEIRTAYPNNPEMWRYLERNPRYINYYLGR